MSGQPSTLSRVDEYGGDPDERPVAVGEDGALGVESLVDEIAQLAREPLAPREFHERLIERAVRAMEAVGGSVWVRTDTGTFREQVGTFLPDRDPARHRARDPRHLELLEEVARGERPRSFSPADDEGDDDARNALDHHVLAAPVVVEGGSVAVVEVLQRPGLFPTVLRGHLEFLGALADLAAEFHERAELRRLRDESATWRDVERFVERAHASLDPRRTAYTIANDGRALVDCDRATVLLGRRPRVMCTSGVDAVERRGTATRRLARLVRAVVRSREPLWFLDASGDLAPELEKPLQQHLEESPARLLAVVPLWETGSAESGRPRAIGAIVAERFDAVIDRGTFRDRVESLARHARPALENAIAHRSMPLGWINRGLGAALAAFGWRRLPTTLSILLVIASVVAALMLVPADFTIEGRAELQPRLRREVFATASGVVEQVLVDHGDPVAAGESVALLRDTDLDYESRRLAGELDTARQRLDGVRAGLLASPPNTADGRLRYNQLTAEHEELRTRIAGLGEQQAILERRERELVVASPLDGRVLTWDARKSLLGRPVKVGHPLMLVANPAGDWIVEVHVPDHRIGHVLRAREELRRDLRVEFVLATEPDVTYEGRVENVALAGEFDGEDSTVLVTVAVDRDEIAQLRPGATVVPRIHCGRRSIGYVWTHEIWETIRTRLLF